jgi:hypothetical protein
MSPEAGPNPEMTTRLERISQELRELEQTLKTAGTVEPRVLRQFRDAVDHVRLTAYTVQQWLELQARRGDPYSVLALLTAERIRRATQLAGDLSIDLDATEVTFETEGLDKLFTAIQGLYERLARLFKK